MMTKIRPRTFFDVEVGGLPMGRIIFELYSDICPDTCENFRALCAGDKGIGQTTEKPLHYKGIVFHRVVKEFMIQGGDFSVGNGTGGESIYGGTFPDENFTVKHSKPFLLSMANRGKDTNGSQFFITTQPTPHLDNVHVVFGEVVSGQEVVSHIEGLPVDRMSRPLQDAKVVNCGELVLKMKTKAKKREVKSSGESASSDADSRSGKSKKRKKSKKSSKKHNKSEDGELMDSAEEDAGKPHPLVSVTKIDPDEIPEVPANKFLYRAGPANNANQKEFRQRFGRERNRGHTKSGRVIKGRGVFRFRTPSRSRSRSMTPPHWKQAQNRTIKLHEFQKMEKERLRREEEQTKREGERKRKFTENHNDEENSEHLNADVNTDGTVYTSNTEVPTNEIPSQIGRNQDNPAVNNDNNGVAPRTKIDQKRGDGKLEKSRSTRPNFDNHRSYRRDSVERFKRRPRSRSRERRRSRDRDHNRKSSRDRRDRRDRHNSPRRRISPRPSVRSDRRRDDRSDRRNEMKRSHRSESKSKKPNRNEDKPGKVEKNNDPKSTVQHKFKRRSRSSSSSSQASAE